MLKLQDVIECMAVTHADAVVEHARDCIVPNWCVPRSEGRVPGRDFCD